MTDPYIGKMLDNRYEILERIGMGGMAVVYKAKCHRLNRLVAIKILKADLAQDEDFRRRFNAESQAVAQLSHPNIVSVYDVSRGGDTEYIVMELIDGITLKQYMEKRGQLNWRESLHFITQIMRGLSHAHSRGIVHRDIKPQNVMVLRDGSVKVADFGIACLENSAQTLTQEALGSVHYISPEQARGDRTDARSDIYSAGVVLYEMLTGRLPFEGDSAVSVAIQHLSSIPLAPREIRPDIPEQLELICMKAMAPELDKRYPSADAMIADLEAFRKNPEVALDIDLIDLRPEETDEPTRPIPVSGNGTVGRAVRERERDPVRERRRDYDDDYEPPRKENKGKTALIAAAAALAVVVAVFLFKSIFASFDKPSETYEVPSVLGLTVEEAKELDTVKDIFKITVEGSDFSDEYKKDEIMAQSPEKGELRKGGSLEIKVTVSLGEDTGVMPDITGTYTVASAKTEMKALIERYNLTLAPEDDRQFSDEVAADYIISTDPEAGEPLKKGDTIRIVVSKGPQPVKVPPFTNIHIDQVTSQLDAMGLEMGSVDEVDSSQPKGYVVEQDPEANSQVPEGTKINFKISNGSQSGGSSGSGSNEEVITIPLPTDRDTVHLQLFQDGNMIFDDVLDCSQGNYVRTITGTGTVILDIYLDGEHTTQEVTFDSYE